MKAIIINLLKSFLLAKGKMVLCLVASMLSAWGISTIIYSKAMTDRDFQQNFSASNPADMIIAVDDPSSTTIKKLVASEYVSAIERRETFTGRIKNKNGNWMSLLIFACKDISRPAISKFSIQQPNSANSLFIEANGLGFLDTGKMLSIQLPGMGSSQLAFGGKAFDPGLPPSQMEQMVYAYTNLSTLNTIAKNNVNTHFLIKLKKNYSNTAEVRQVSHRLKNLLAQNGNTVTSVVIPPPGEHPHQNIVNGVAFLQNSLGVTLSLLGVVLLSLILLTWLYPQIVNVGIMKTVGASSRMVLAGYLIVLLLIIGIGLLPGLPLGYITARAYSRFVDFLQNFEPVETLLPVPIHLRAIMVIAILPIITSAIPLVRVANTSVYKALNKIFYTSYTAAFTFTNRFFTNTKFKYSVNNLFRSSQRTGLLLLMVIAGIALFSAGFNLRYSLKEDFRNYIKYSEYEITVLFNNEHPKKLPGMHDLRFVENAEYLFNAGVQYKSEKSSYFQNAILSSLSPGYKLSDELVVKGTLHNAKSNYLYISQMYAEDFSDTPIGKVIELEFEDGLTEKFIFGGIIKNFTAPVFYRFSNKENDKFNELAVKVKKGFEIETATRLIEDEFAKRNIEIKQILNTHVKLEKLENHLMPTYLIIQVMGIITLVIALAGLLIVLNLSLQERAQEMGIMKALGSSAGDIESMYQNEYRVITAIALIKGILSGWLLNAAICNLFGVMVIQVPIKPIVDMNMLMLLIILLAVVQTLLIRFFIRIKIKRTSAGMIRNL